MRIYRMICARCGDEVLTTASVRKNGNYYHQKSLESCRWRPFKARKVLDRQAAIERVRDAEQKYGLTPWEFGA